MLAIDTNIVVRFLIADNESQAIKVKALLAGNVVFVATTVLMESDWVLRSTFGLKRAQAVDRLRAFVGLPAVRLQEPERVGRALAWAEAGMDFADALHLAAADACEAFVSFDKKLAKAARHAPAVAIRAP
jgi:predicted nucleic acid-binding protein